jgi:probable phosphoglycerate mutase
MTTVVFVRHGETEWNRNGRWQGHADVPLSAEGRNQARRLAARLVAEGRAFDRVYASDLHRAFETAEIVAQSLGLPVHPLFELREMHLGTWSGLTSDEIRMTFPDQWALYQGGSDFRRGEHGETMADFRARIVRVVDELVRSHPQMRLLVVTHGGSVRALLYSIHERTRQFADTPIGNTSITEIIFGGEKPEIVRANDTRHLADPAQTDLMAPL